MYINTDTKQYPVSLADIRAANPGDGIPDDAQTAAVIDYGYARVVPKEQPSLSQHQRVIEGAPALVEGAWTQTWIVTDWTDEEIAASQKAQTEALIKHYDFVVQTHLDGVAQSFGYGDPNRPEVSPILHAISYAEEPAVERFMNEGRALRAWRSLVWDKAASILNAVKAQTRAIPTEAELLAELPDPPTQDPL